MDITKLFGEMGQFRSKMEAVKKQMVQLEITKEVGAGLVKVTVNGDKQLLSLSIDETLLNKKDQKMVEDLIVGAVNVALQEVDGKVQEVIQRSAVEL